jgi:transposase-like protein
MTIRKHEVPDELLSGLLANYRKPEDLIGENGLLKQLTKLLVEKALDAEMTEHLGHDKHGSGRQRRSATPAAAAATLRQSAWASFEAALFTATDQPETVG